MDNNHNICSKILFWNVRGIHSQEKWDALREKINESACQVICIQETKRESFDNFYLKKFCPRYLDKFAFSPSARVSGGLLTVWNSNFFNGSVIHSNSYAITVKLTCRLDNKHFHITNIYGPANSQ
jgi:exonuclease III